MHTTLLLTFLVAYGQPQSITYSSVMPIAVKTDKLGFVAGKLHIWNHIMYYSYYMVRRDVIGIISTKPKD